MEEKLITFLRKRDYTLIKELGQGACGKTVLLRDDVLNEAFVCKKYSPFYEEHKKHLFDNFVREIKLLHQIYHKNIVRIFNYYLYPELFSGYILMEHVDGKDIEEYLRTSPEQVNEIFLQTIEGFCHLEANNILHRDIRPQNLLVHEDGTVKIIDLGFGKQVQESADFDKSISLNWWCAPPAEFSQSTYDFRTEVYFVGKLFEKLIREHNIGQFNYKNILVKMCTHDPQARAFSFFDIQKSIKNDLFLHIAFEDDELIFYREFADATENAISKIENGTKYIDDVERIKVQLEIAYRNCMLEETVPDSATILRGSYWVLRSW